MPTYQGFKWNGGEVKVRPMGIRRVFRSLWFKTGDTPRILITFKRTDGSNAPTGFQVLLDQPGLKLVEADVKEMAELNIGRKREFPIELNRIETPRHYRYQVTLRNVPNSRGNPEQQVVCFFEAVTQEEVTLRIFGIAANLVAALLGGLVGAVITLLLTG